MSVEITIEPDDMVLIRIKGKNQSAVVHAKRGHFEIKETYPYKGLPPIGIPWPYHKVWEQLPIAIQDQ